MKQVKQVLHIALALALALPLAGWTAEERERGVGDVVYVPTPQVVVDEMLTMAKVGPKDFIVDLGSGDGRMVITAAKKFGARGFGVDLSDELLREARANAVSAGVADRAQFVKQNLFETDLQQATVLTTYLLPEMNEKLRPKILSLPPGTRVVAHDYPMGDWRPDEQKTLSVPEKVVGTPGISYTYLWIVPARIGGRWQAQINSPAHTGEIELEFAQRFQQLEGTVRNGAQRVALVTPKIQAARVSFSFFTKAGDNATRHDFTGSVKGDAMEGTLTIGCLLYTSPSPRD